MFGKKSKVPPKSLKKRLLFGIPANIAVGPLGFRAELDVGPEDESSPGPSRVVLRWQDRKSEGPPVEETPASTISIEGTDHAKGNTAGEDASNAEQEDSVPAIASKEPETDRRSSPREGADTPSNVAQEAVDGFGPLKATLEKFFAVCADSSEYAAVRNKLDVLSSRIASLDSVFATPPGNVSELRRRDDLIRDLGTVGKELRSLCDNPAGPLQDSKVVFKSLEDLQGKILHYQTAQQTMINNQGLKQMDPAEATILNNFPSAQQAEYRHSNRSGCLKGTRSAILDEIELWTRDYDKPPVYWLNGLAGTGKSTIAQTVADRAFADGRLGASFFCSRDFEDRSNLQLIFPTIAVQLARMYPEFRSIFVPRVQSDPGVAHESLCGQMNKLIVQPLVESRISTVIVVDALDECKDEESISAILSVLGQFVAEIPDVKFFVTGRPEPRILTGFRLPLLVKATDVFVLHEVELSQVDNDIRMFFKHKFSEIKSRQLGLVDWPSEKQLDRLCERAAGLFVYAMATIRCIDQKNKTPEGQLDRLLCSVESRMEGKARLKTNKTLDSLYMTILQGAFGDDDPEDDPKVRSVLGAVILATNPLSPSAIAALLDLDPRYVFSLLSSINSLLVLREDIGYPVQPFHKSFPDFLIDSTRCTDQRFCVSPSDQHTEILVACLDLMNQKLEQNMCKLPDCVTNSEVKYLKERAKQYVNNPLQYACKSWYKHLINVTPTHTLNPIHALHRFLEGKFVFWLEVLSILGAAREAVDALEASAKWLGASPTLDLVNDYTRFVIAFFEVISISAPHIYHSALHLSPKMSIVRKLYGQYAHPFARVVCGLGISWDPVIATVHNKAVIKAVLSPCDRFIAISCNSVEILDATTLKSLPRLDRSRGILAEGSGLSFSPNSRLITFCDWKKIISWDLQTGGRVAEFQMPWGAGYLSSTYSTDEKILVVATRNANNTSLTLLSYDLSKTHEHPHRVSEGYAMAPIWTHGECVRFAAVRKGFITVSEVGFTSSCPPIDIKSSPAPDGITSRQAHHHLFLPTRSRLAFILYGQILVWDTQESRFILESNDWSYTEVVFSPDGRFLMGSSDDEVVRVWKESPAGYELHQKLEMPVGRDPLLLLSPKEKSIIMTGKRSIQLRSTTDPILPLSDSLTRRTDWTNFIVAFSSDQSLAGIARRGEGAVTVVDLKSCDTRLVIDTGVRVNSLGLDAVTLVVVGSEKAAVWIIPAKDQAPDAQAIQTIDLGYSPAGPSTYTNVRTSVSHNLNRIAVAKFTYQGPRELKIYDVTTGECLVGTDLENSKVPAIISFAPDEDLIWFVDPPDIVEEWVIFSRRGLIDLHRRPGAPLVRHRGRLAWEKSPDHHARGGWILDSATRRRILWLPHHWRSNNQRHRTWSGRFLGLLHEGLLEAVILEFE